MADDGGGQEEPASRGPAGEGGDGNYAVAAKGEEIVNDHEAANRPPRGDEAMDIATPKFWEAGRLSSMNLSVDISSPTGDINSLPVGVLASPGSNSQGGEWQSSDATTPQDQASNGGRRGSKNLTATSPPDGEVCTTGAPSSISPYRTFTSCDIIFISLDHASRGHAEVFCWGKQKG
jgi:hypothetical protein